MSNIRNIEATLGQVYTRDMNILQTHNSNLSETNRQLQNLNAEKEQCIQNILVECNDTKACLSATTTKLNATTIDLDNQMKCNADLVCENKALANKNAQLCDQCTALESNLVNLKNEYIQTEMTLQDQVNAMQARNNALTDDNNRLVCAIEGLKTENSKLTCTANNLSNANLALKADLTSTRAEVDRLSAMHMEDVSSNQTLNNRLQELTHENNVCTDKIEQLSMSLAQAECENQSCVCTIQDNNNVMDAQACEINRQAIAIDSLNKENSFLKAEFNNISCSTRDLSARCVAPIVNIDRSL